MWVSSAATETHHLHNFTDGRIVLPVDITDLVGHLEPRRRQTVSKAQQDIRRKIRALEHAARTGNIRQTSGTTTSGSATPRCTAPLKRHGMNRLPNRVGRRAVHTHRYEKQVPGHHVQVDVKFLTFQGERGRIRRYQYTAIDDATRVRALKIYPRHTQQNAIAFVDHVIRKFPFRIHTVRTDRGHEFQALFHWHLADQGIRHVYIKPRSPQLNGKVERSHRTDQQEFYQLLSYTDDVDLAARLAEWETFYNYHRPHAAFAGKTPYEALRERLQ